MMSPRKPKTAGRVGDAPEVMFQFLADETR